MNYYYKEKGWFYFGFKYSESLINELQKRFRAQFNPANKEWYVKAELWNISYINEFIEENNFVEQYPEREREIELPLSSDVFDVDVTKALVSELGLQRKPRDYQYEGIAYMLNHENTINGCDVGLGKAQPLDMKIPTPRGLINFGDLRMGDLVFGSDGCSQKIEAIYPQGIKDCYKVFFTDGSSVECCDEHLWSVRAWKQTNPLQTVSLKMIMGKPLRGKSCNDARIKGHESKGYWKWKLPIIKNPVDFEKKEVLLDPYTLGFLIGDGCLRKRPSVVCVDEEILSYLKFPEGCVLKKQDKNIDYRIIDPVNKRKNRVKEILEQYNLMEKYSYEKEIPEDYIFNSKEVRLAVLQGILDSDGYISKTGLIEFACTSKKLVEQVGFIAKSLGGVHNPIRIKKSHYKNPKGEKIKCRDHYRIGINLPQNINPCRLKRKSDLLTNTRKLTPNRSICKIEYIGKKEMQCIKVSNPDALYVCGEDFLLTHNTTTTITYLELLDLFPCIIVCPSTVKSGWKKEWGIINPSRSVSIIGTKKKKDWDADVIIINYDLLGSSTKYINKKGEEKRKVEVKFPEFFLREYHAIVADEIHLLKNSKAIRSKAFRLLSKGIERIIGLSGTLIMNRPSELYNILQITGWYNKIFPDWEYYYYRYCNLKISEYGRDSSCSSNVKELYEILSHYCYFRKEKREVLTELPPIIEQVFEIELSNKKAYKKAEEDLIEYLSNIDLEKIEKALRAQTLVQLNILFQLSIEGKMKQIELYIKEWLEANEDSKLLVFGIHKDPLIKLASCFDESCLITGDLSLANKEKEKDAFIERKDKRVLFANIQCIGTGVDGLQKVCSNGIFIELPVRPSELVQAIGRIERMGQKDSINISYLLSPDSVDMKIWDMLKTKKNITDQVIKGYEDDVSLGLLKSYVRET